MNNKFRAIWLRVAQGRAINHVIFRRLDNPKSLLDIGCGTGESFKWIKESDYFGKLSKTYCVGIDLFKASLVKAKNAYADVICCHSNHLPFRPLTFDVVLSTEVLEHLTKRDGYSFLKNAEYTAKKQVFITTPVMNVIQAENEWKVNPHQKHLSIWHPQELRKLGYTVIGLRGAKALYGESHQSGVDFKIKSSAVKLLFILLVEFSELFSYYCPSIALDQAGIKEIS